MPDEFSVVEFYNDGTHCYIVRWTTAQDAVEMAAGLVSRALIDHDHVRRIIITDGGDCTAFEWKRGEGVTLTERRNP